jgi:hypothetical protein
MTDMAAEGRLRSTAGRFHLLSWPYNDNNYGLYPETAEQNAASSRRVDPTKQQEQDFSDG